MKPEPNRNLILPWTPQREKASGNHLLPRKQATSLRWLKAVSSTLQDVDFDVSLLPLVVT